MGPTWALDVTWVGPNNGFWDTAANWNPALPSSNSDVKLGAFDTEFRAGTAIVNWLLGTGRLALSAGSLSIVSDSSIGSLQMTGGTFNAGGPFAASALNLSGGMIRGPSTATFAGPSTWTGNGSMTDAGSTTFSGALELSGTGTGRGVSYRTVNFNGATTWSNVGGAANTGNIYVNGATLNNNGTWLDQLSANAAIVDNGGVNSFNNSGSYIKSGEATTDLSAVRFVNSGTTDVQRGTLTLPSNFANAGALMGSGQVRTNALTNNGHVAPGESPGTLTIVGNFVQSAQGFLDIDLQNLSSVDLLRVTGSATLGGTLNVICYATCTVAAGQVFTILDAAPNSLIGTFADLQLTGFAPDSFTVVYDNANGDVLLNAVTSVPEPGTWLLLLSGTAALLIRRSRS